ncbi:rab11 family-interacting protein 4 isoform X2 [Eurytemora carolleeae]|uniref:rab11 family-interacting protein 4 isoform X2 n=1 Tax=Eurytemora carolleeae TaxID=1294199 RepID=UPI000C782D7F|nr:rab11 family-interacting protein 4 isoform X2 [Eurytemora carolleeae]|eukprot:XP_023332078.1 rab11 family-interacting protein 4-like isoform X2 [Eurytemora affinis]
MSDEFDPYEPDAKKDETQKEIFNVSELIGNENPKSKDEVIIEDLLGDFSTPWVSEGVKTISNSENISKTSFFLLDLDTNDSSNPDFGTSQNKRLEEAEDIDEEEDEDEVTLENSQASDLLSINDDLPQNDESELSSGFFFNDLVKEERTGFSTKSSAKDVFNGPKDNVQILPDPQIINPEPQDILSFLEPESKPGAEDPLKPKFHLGIVDPKSGFLTEPSLFTSLQPNPAYTLESEKDYTSLLDLPREDTTDSLPYDSSEVTEIQGFEDSEDENDDLEIEREKPTTSVYSVKDTLIGSFDHAPKKNKSPRLIRQEEIDAESAESDEIEYNIEIKPEGDFNSINESKSTVEEHEEPKLMNNMALSMEELEKQVRPVFDHCDTDNDGLISIDHLIQLCNDHNKDPEKLINRLQFKFDDEGSEPNLIDFNQFLQGVATLLGNEEQAENQEVLRETEEDKTPEPCTSSAFGVPDTSSWFGVPEKKQKFEDSIDGCLMSVTMNSHPRTISPPSPRSNSSPHSLTDSALGVEGDFSTSPDLRQADFSDEREEILECFGEKDHVDFDSDVTDSSFVRGFLNPSRGVQEGGTPLGDIPRNTWLRTSLRRSSPNTENLVPPRRWASFRTPRNRSTASFASALYQSGNPASFNSSGRSSNCDDGEMQDLHSDISIEDDVIDLNNKVQQLQEQVGILADNQATNDDRYTRVKQENAALTARIHMLEEHIRELEVRSEERLGEEQRRNRELLARLEREKQLELENYAIRNNALEQEVSRLREDNTESRREVERLRDERAGLQGQLMDTQRELGREKEVRREGEEERRMEREVWEREQQAASQLIQDLSREVEEQREIVVLNHQTDSGLHSAEDIEMSGDLNSRIANMEIQIRNLRDKNTKLEESNEELQAQMLNKGLDEGRRLLDSSAANNSLAAEFEAMSENECPEALYAEIEKMRKTLKEQQEENRHLRSYIDTVLLNIMDKYPELLEIRAAK